MRCIWSTWHTQHMEGMKRMKHIQNDVTDWPVDAAIHRRHRCRCVQLVNRREPAQGSKSLFEALCQRRDLAPHHSIDLNMSTVTDCASTKWYVDIIQQTMLVTKYVGWFNQTSTESISSCYLVNIMYRIKSIAILQQHQTVRHYFTFIIRILLTPYNIISTTRSHVFFHHFFVFFW